MKTILFWDIDGTLLTTGRAGVFAWELAAERVLGQKVDFSALRTAGLTDVEIARKIFDASRVAPTDQAVATLLSLYEEFLPDSLPRRQGQVMPGVIDLFAALAELDEVASYLLTGNTRAGAKAKLSYYGLYHLINEGAFADGCRDRHSIAVKALTLACDAMGAVSLDRCFVIGDTPHDIRCGRAIGACTIAVATGDYSKAELAEHQPDIAFSRLPNPEIFLSAIGLIPRG